MDEDSETTQDIPKFIRNSIEQLTSLKSNIAKVDIFNNNIKKKNVNVDMIDFANQVKDFLNTLNTTVTDINSTFLISFEAFIDENKVTNKKTGKISSDNENVNTDLGDNLLQKDKAGDSVQSDSDASMIETTDKLDKNSSKQQNSEISDSDKKSSKQKNSEISDSDKKSSKQMNSGISDSGVGLRTSKLRKKRRKTVSTSRISENGNTDSDSTGKNTDISNTMPEDNIEFSDAGVHNSKINEKIIHEVHKTSEVISDSDKENAKNEKIKELTKETNKKLTSELNNNSDSEKELSCKTHKKKSKKVVQSDNETDSSTKNLKDNEIMQKLGESTTDCDLDSDNRKSKSLKKTHKKSKVTCDSNTEYPKRNDSLIECDKSISSTKNLKLGKSTNLFDSDSDLDLDSIISKTANKRNKKNNKSNDGSGSDADNQKKDRKLVEPDNESDSSVKKLKENENTKKLEEGTDKLDSDDDFDSGSSKFKSAKETNKTSEKSKVVDKSDIDNPKKDTIISESDNESDSNTKKLKETEKKKRPEESTKKTESDNESDSEVLNKKSKASKKNKKYKVVDNSDIDNPKKDNQLSESDNESDSNKKKLKKTVKKKKLEESTKKIESDNDEGDSDVPNKKSKASKKNKKSKVVDNSDIENPKKDNQLSESDNESDSNKKKLKKTVKKKKLEESKKKMESDNDEGDSDVPNKKSKATKKNKKAKVVDNSDIDNPKRDNQLSESDNESDSNKKKLKETEKKIKLEESKKKMESDNDEGDLDVPKKKSKDSKKNKKSKVVDNSDIDNPKKDNQLSESDNESDSNKKKLKEIEKKKKLEESKKRMESDNDEGNSDVPNKKSKASKKNKKSKVVDNSDIDDPKKDNQLSESDNELDSNTKKFKETEKKKKSEKKTKKIESDNDESDSDVRNKKSKANKKNKEKRKSESEFDVGQKDSDNETIDSSKKKEVTNDSNSEDSNATKNDSDSRKKKSKGRKKHKNKSKKSESESDIDQKESDKTNSKNDELEDTINEVNKTNRLDDDSDSYLEDPRIIIEKSKKALAERKKSGLNTKSNSELSISKDSESTKTNDDLFDALKNNESNDTNSVDSNSTKNTKSKKYINKIGDKNDKKDTSDDTDSSVDNQNENCDQTTIDKAVSNENDSETNKDDENEKEEKPKIGFLKCIDINKLLDPEVAKKDEVVEVNKAVSSKKNDSVIILSSSDSDCKMVENRKRSKTSKNIQKIEEKCKKSKESVKKLENNKEKVKKEDSDDNKPRSRYDRKREKDSDESSDDRTRRSRRDRNKDSDESSVDQTRRLRIDRKKQKLLIAKQTFEQLRVARRIRVSLQKSLKKSIKENTSSDSESDSSTSSKTYQKKSVYDKKRQSKNQSFNIDPNYDYTKDIKFKVKCYVSLPKIPVEKLKKHYLQEQEDAEILRLTNMNSLKRTRQQKGATSSSDSDVKKDKKRAKTVEKQTKLQQRKKKIDNDDEDGQTEHSDNESHMSDESIINTEDINKKDVNPPIPDDILESDKDISNDSSDDEDEDKKKSKNGNKKKSDKKNDKEKTKNDTEENGKDSEEQKEDTEKSKWRNDPLLRGKLDASDSEEELIRFRNKKNKIADDIKSKTKKQIKRMARRLGSDVSSSEDEKENEPDSEKENSVKSLSSDSEEEQNTKKKPVRRRIKRVKDSDESTDGEERAKRDRKKKKDEEEESTRKKIRHVWSKDSLAQSTKEAVKEEEERKKRISDKQKLYNEIYDNKLDLNAKVDKVILDFNEETKEELLSVHPDLVAKLKPHQAKGVQFMWTACFESLERAKNTEGSGCILAHCMGLGKTLQVITLIHTLLTNTDETNVQTVLVVCPLSTVLNWVSEFKKWLDDLDGEQVNVFDLVQHKQNYERLYQMQDWMKFGGVLVIGYDMFRNLSNPKGKRMSKKLATGFNKVLLEPGPDLVVCDEGHLLKNEKTGISIAMNKLRTKRRIVLTGTPLQNNLKEYFCMVQFVKPSLLGTYKEYLNRFVNPITNGQYTDSTPHDIQIMRRRAHVLHKMLDAVVERRDYNVLAPFLPPKHEFVLFITLTPCQIDLYREYLTKFSRNTEVKGTSYLFQDFQELQRICIHPRVLLDKSNQDKLRRDNLEEDDDSEGSLKDFINDDESDKSTTADETSDESGSDSNKKPSVSTRRTRANPAGHAEEVPEPEAKSEEWWSKFCQTDELDNIDHSSKIKLLFDILHQCEMIGDKMLIFSQSLYSLNLIEYFLTKIDDATQSGDTVSSAQVGGYSGSWALGLDYFRLDGSTSCENRATWCKTFNNEANTRARLFLISTRAGGLGINLVAANRVIVFDVSWNPSYDIQSIYRVYRFGQTKPCYIYRFVTLGTMENKIYERQVTKQAISKRVIDEQQIDRHYNQTDLAELYAFNPIPDEERPIPLVPKDRLFADLLQSHEKYIFKYHEHNSLLEDKADEGLNEEERRAAWEEFENEKTAPKFNLMQTMVRNGMFETLRILVQEDNSGWTPAQINNILPMIVQRISEQVTRGDYSMYRRVEERHELRVLEQRRMQMIYQQYMQQLRNGPGGGPMTPADINKLAQMISAYNQNLMQPRPQVPSSSTALATFRQGDPPPPAAPIPHPAVNEVVELND